MSPPWYVIGFTSDAIVLAYQDARMAEACMNAWIAAGRPSACRIAETTGEGPHLIYWLVNEEAAAVLDAGGVEWRNLIVARCTEAPSDCNDILERSRAT